MLGDWLYGEAGGGRRAGDARITNDCWRGLVQYRSRMTRTFKFTVLALWKVITLAG